MAFLYPLVWVGALAVAVPIVLHLRRRSDADVVRFSAMRFLDDQPAPKRDALRLRDVPLLGLRILALLLLLGAFSWPYRDFKALVESRVYVLDNTLSHQAGGGFARARDALVAEVLGTAARSQVAVIELTTRPRVISHFGDSSQSVAETLRALEPSFERGSYREAFAQAVSLLASEPRSEKHLMVYGDNQQNQWNEILEGQRFQEQVNVLLVTGEVGHGSNLWLRGPRVQRTLAGEGSLIEVSVELHHRGVVGPATWTLLADGRDIVSRAVDFTAGAGSVLLTAQWETDSLGEIGGEIRISGTSDDLPGDDQLYFTVPAVSMGTVALLARSPYLRAALSPEVMQGFWNVRMLERERISETLQAGQFADVLCLESDFLTSPEARDLVLQYLDRDRGVLLLVNRATPLIGSFLGRIGIELLDPPVAVSEDPTFRYVYGDHPILRPFRSPDFGSLAEVKVYRHSRLAASAAKPLIFSQTGDPLFLEAGVGKGRLLVSTFGFDREDSDWPLQATFVPFLDLCLHHARHDRGMPTAFESGQRLAYDLPPDTAVNEFVLRDGNGEVFRGEVRSGRIEFIVPRKPGTYALTYDVKTSGLPNLLSVNPSPLESELSYLASVESAQASVNDLFPKTQGEARLDAEPARLQVLHQRLWWFALLAALALLLVENVWLTVRGIRA